MSAFFFWTGSYRLVATAALRMAWAPARRGIIHRFRAVGEGAPVEAGRLGHIAIRNDQEVVDVDVEGLERHVGALLEAARCRHFDLGIWLTTDDVVRELNREHRGLDEPTDVLSFAFHDEAEPGEIPQAVPLDDDDLLNLGDLVISVPYVSRVCEQDALDRADPERNGETRGVAAAMAGELDVGARLPLLVIHGILHLMGYDHESDDDYETMVRLEDDLIAKFREQQQRTRDDAEVVAPAGTTRRDGGGPYSSS